MTTIQSYLPRWLDRLQPSKTAVLLGTAVAVGIGTGLGAVFFIWLIGTIETLFFGQSTTWFGGLGRWLFILIPAVGGLLGGPIIAYFAPEAKGHGVPEVMQAIALQGGRMRPRVVIAKVVASALCIGSGGSAGREGPIVQVGASLGSVLGQWFHLSEMRIRNLVACGAAASCSCRMVIPNSRPGTVLPPCAKTASPPGFGTILFWPNPALRRIKRAGFYLLVSREGINKVLFITQETPVRRLRATETAGRAVGPG